MIFDYSNLIYNHNYNDQEFLQYEKKKCLDNIRSITQRKIDYCNSILNSDKPEKYNVFQKQMASFGGEISGQTRRYKQELIEYIANTLFDQNHEDFNILSVRELRLFFKLTFGNAPSQNFFIRHHQMVRREKQQFYYLKDFKEYTESNIGKNDHLVKLNGWYLTQMDYFKREVQTIKNESNSLMKEVKKTLVKDDDDEQKRD